VLGEAASRFDLGVALGDAGSHDEAARQLWAAAKLFGSVNDASRAAEAQLVAGGALAEVGRFGKSVDCFAAAAALLDRYPATRVPGQTDHLLRIQIEASWLDALLALAGSKSGQSDLADAALDRCDQLLSLTRDAAPPETKTIRFHACYQKARLLTLRKEVVAALPWAREAADYAAHASLPVEQALDRAAIEIQMRFTTSGAYIELGDVDAAEPELIRLAELADAHGDRDSSTMALRQLADVLRRHPPRAAKRFGRLAAAYRATGARHSEAIALLEHAKARRAVPGTTEPETLVRISELSEQAAEAFDDLGEVARAAEAYYAAAVGRSDAALLRPEYRESAARLFGTAAERFAESGQWWGHGLARQGKAELLNRWYEGIERDARHIDALLTEALESFERAERPGEAAGVRVLLAAGESLRAGPTDRWLQRSLDAVSSYGPARASRVLPLEREFHDRQESSGFALIGTRAWECAADRKQADPRLSELVWGLEQVTKARSFQDQLNEPAVWQRFLASDDKLRELTRDIEQAEFRLGAVLRQRDVALAAVAEGARAALQRATRHQRERLDDLATHSESLISLASSPNVALPTLQSTLCAGELYVGFLMLPDDRVLRTQVTTHAVRFDALNAPDVGYLLLKQQHQGGLSDIEKERLHSTVAGLLGVPASGVDTVIVCPDRQLVAIPWNLLPADGGLLGDAVTTAMVPAAGAFVQQRRGFERPATSAFDGRSYLGVADSRGDPRCVLKSVDWEVENIRASYFDLSGRAWLTGEADALLEAEGHVGLLHLACHARVGGLMFTNRIVTPMDLADMRLSADVLLLTGCETAAFGHDESNEFFGIVRQLLVGTQAKAAVASMWSVVDDSGPLFCDLVVSALTGRAFGRPWTLPSGPCGIGDAVRWARIQMRQLTEGEAQPFVPNKRVEPVPGDVEWWSPWCVIGDPKAGLEAISR
jgi:hypothetical protein